MNKKIIYYLTIGITILLITTSCQDEISPPEYEYFTDTRDGETYKYVQIGNQYWMSENLRFKPDSGNFWAYNNIETDVKTFGYLYAWETANKVCPAGWHLPSNIEWKELADNLGGKAAAGGKMKVAGTTYWNPPNKDATNSSGFSALPCGTYTGSYLGNDEFDGRGNLIYFWSSEVNHNIWWLSSGFGSLGESIIGSPHIASSASVRCIRD